MHQAFDPKIIVAGAGPAGLIAALSLANAGFAVVLCGPGGAETDRRTTALMQPSLLWLAGLGVLGTIEASGAPLRAMRIVDGTSRLIRSPDVTFRASEIDEDAFGLNVPNQALVSALEEAVRDQPLIQRRDTTIVEWAIGSGDICAKLADGTTALACLAVAADGRNSQAREAAGIDVSTRDYPQTALVLTFQHTRDHGFVSTEFHTETGPFTQVPLPGRRSSLVWVVSPETAQELSALDDATISRRVEDRMQSMLGAVMVEGERQSYKLSASSPSRFGKNRVALVGEAAHLFPPIGAQGLNLGIRDVRDLVDVVGRHASDPGSATALAAYDARRRPDILARSGAVKLLNASLLSPGLAAQVARGAGLGILGAFSPLRGFVMREGLAPGSGFRALFKDGDRAATPRP